MTGSADFLPDGTRMSELRTTEFYLEFFGRVQPLTDGLITFDEP